ncbi:hypothetical protein BDV18DRAFT_97287 [Aspergillus unguis]
MAENILLTLRTYFVLLIEIFQRYTGRAPTQTQNQSQQTRTQDFGFGGIAHSLFAWISGLWTSGPEKGSSNNKGNVNRNRNRNRDGSGKDTTAAVQEPPPPGRIRLKDPLNRTFLFPYELVRSWPNMQTLLNQAFGRIETLGPQVERGHFDLLGPNDRVIYPDEWEFVLQPGWEMRMVVWDIPAPLAPAGQVSGMGKRVRKGGASSRRKGSGSVDGDGKVKVKSEDEKGKDRARRRKRQGKY